MVNYAYRIATSSDQNTVRDGALPNVYVENSGWLNQGAGNWDSFLQSSSRREGASVALEKSMAGVEIDRRSSTSVGKYSPARLAQRRDQFKASFRARVDLDNFEFGIKSSVELFVEDSLASDPVFTKLCLNELYIENIGNEKLTIGILKIIAHTDRAILYPVADTIALAALSHCSVEVRECGVRAFEYWESAETLNVLEHTSLSPDWLEEYKLEVIENIRGAQ